MWLNMSVVSLTSPPEKSSRRVRFSLPEATLTLYNDKRTLHGTTKYVNGTLINVTSTIHSANERTKNEINGVFKSSLKTNGISIPGKETSQSYKVSFNVRPASLSVKDHGRNSLPNTASASVVGRRRQTKTITKSGEKSCNTLPIIERKSSSLEDFEEDSLDGDFRDETGPEMRPRAYSNLTRYKSSDDLTAGFKGKSSVAKLPDAQNGSLNNIQKKPLTSNTLKVPDYTDTISTIFLVKN